ncbi:MAG TPA: hypothetical protein VHH73_20710 [Verrucomicrobiae bacterium]|nr:hypothetical protein [Verrucomicrobiae bacterium]
MSKPALGRGLGDLLKGARVEAKPPSETVAKPANGTPVTPGLGRLLEGQAPRPLKPWQRPSQPPLPAQPASASTPARVPLSKTRLLLLCADGTVLALCARLAWANRGKLGVLDTLLCVAGVALAATLGATALKADNRD